MQLDLTNIVVFLLTLAFATGCYMTRSELQFRRLRKIEKTIINWEIGIETLITIIPDEWREFIVKRFTPQFELLQKLRYVSAGSLVLTKKGKEQLTPKLMKKIEELAGKLREEGYKSKEDVEKNLPFVIFKILTETGEELEKACKKSKLQTIQCLALTIAYLIENLERTS